MPDAPLITTRHAPTLLRAIGRYFFTGNALYGPGDNATFFHHATADYRGRPYVKLTRRKWERLARRHAGITVPAALAIAAPWWSLRPLLAYALAMAVATAWLGMAKLVTWIRSSRDAREWTDPAAKVLAGLIQVRYTKRHGREWIDLPRGWGRGHAATEDERPAVRIHIPERVALDARLKGRITTNVGARLGIPEPVQGVWHEAGSSVYVDLSAAPLPPREVELEPILRAIREADDETVIVGRKHGGHLVSVSLAEDSPHFLGSGPSGTGKSVLARLIMVQRAMRGDGLIITDPKRFSHWRWAGGGKLPQNRVIYAYRVEDLHDAWVAVGEEIARRIELPEEELAGQRRVFVTVEEANVQTKKLTRYWKGKRKEIIQAAKLAMEEDQPYDPADLDPPQQSPAIVAMQEAVCMGRELRMHVLVFAQRASASIFGGNGGDIRESFQGGRFIAKWDRPLWKMLVSTLAYVAWPSGPRGIWGLAREEFEIFRVPFLPEDMATDLVRGGQPVAGPVLGQQRGQATIDGHVQDGQTGHGGQPVGQSGRLAIAAPVRLANALDMLPGQDGPQAITLETLRWHAKRPGFPAPIGQDGRAGLYRLDDLIDWRESMIHDRTT
jgi:hypothetical protein